MSPEESEYEGSGGESLVSVLGERVLVQPAHSRRVVRVPAHISPVFAKMDVGVTPRVTE